MPGNIEQRLAELDIKLPEPPAPVASYVPYVVSGKLVFISGQVTAAPDGLKYVGTVGQELSLDDGKPAVRLSAVHGLARMKRPAGGNLDRVTRCVKLVVIANSVISCAQPPEVPDGASDVIVEV